MPTNPKEMFLCPDCFGQEHLKTRIEEIRPEVGEGKCKFHKTKEGVPIGEIAKIVDSEFKWFYEVTSGFFSDEGDSLDICIHSLTNATNLSIAEAIANQIVEDEDWGNDEFDAPFYQKSWNYNKRRSHHYSSWEWKRFCRSITHFHRHFNNYALRYLRYTFKDIHELNNAVFKLKKGTEVFRARLVQDHNEKITIIENPQKELCIPPRLKRRANRLNASGIKCFYGAYDADTAIAELRPSVGGTAIVGKFELVRDINVLDTTRFTSASKYELFSHEAVAKRERHSFMQFFKDEISKPTQSADEHLDYIPTQVIAEFLLHKYKCTNGKIDGKIEGIIYNSSQKNGGKNLALFDNAALSLQNQLEKNNESYNPPEVKKRLNKKAVESCGVDYVKNSAASHRIEKVTYKNKEVI